MKRPLKIGEVAPGGGAHVIEQRDGFYLHYRLDETGGKRDVEECQGWHEVEASEPVNEAAALQKILEAPCDNWREWAEMKERQESDRIDHGYERKEHRRVIL